LRLRPGFELLRRSLDQILQIPGVQRAGSLRRNILKCRKVRTGYQKASDINPFSPLLTCAPNYAYTESNGESVDSIPAEKVLNDCFHSMGVSFKISVGSERFIDELSIADIRSVSGYVQDEWIWGRERGVVIETNDGKQFRFVSFRFVSFCFVLFCFVLFCFVFGQG
jgi:hypothetical protein